MDKILITLTLIATITTGIAIYSETTPSCNGLSDSMASYERVSSARNGYSMCKEIQRYQKDGAIAQGRASLFKDLNLEGMIKTVNTLRKAI